MSGYGPMLANHSVSAYDAIMRRDPRLSWVQKFGRNPDLDIGREGIWTPGGSFVWRTTAVAVEAISTSLDDTVAGDGARKIVVQGLDENWEQVQEEIEMNGTSVTASTTQTFLRVYRAWVSETGLYGAAGENKGIITIRETGAGATLADIYHDGTKGMGQTEMAYYTVPRYHTAYLIALSAHVKSTQSADIALFKRFNDGVNFNQPNRLVHIAVGVAGISDSEMHGADSFPEKTDIWMGAKTVTNNTEVQGDFILLLVRDKNK